MTRGPRRDASTRWRERAARTSAEHAPAAARRRVGESPRVPRGERPCRARVRVHALPVRQLRPREQRGAPRDVREEKAGGARARAHAAGVQVRPPLETFLRFRRANDARRFRSPFFHGTVHADATPSADSSSAARPQTPSRSVAPAETLRPRTSRIRRSRRFPRRATSARAESGDRRVSAFSSTRARRLRRRLPRQQHRCTTHSSR